MRSRRSSRRWRPQDRLPEAPRCQDRRRPIPIRVPELDLSRYLERVGLRSAPPATADGLAAIHEAHATHIPFENIDVLLGRKIRLDVPGLQAKLVDARRGG